MEPPVPTVSVVMPTYNRRAQLRTVLAPLLADPAATEIVVVVDGSATARWRSCRRSPRPIRG